MNDDFDWNINIIDQCAKPEDFSSDMINAAWETRWNCPGTVVDPVLYIYGA